MGHVKRKTFTRPFPAGAEIVSKKGSEYAEWLDRNGKKQSAPVTTGRNGSPRVRVEARTYTAIYRDGRGITREHATGCRAKRSAETVLAKLEQEAEKVRSGILSATESEMAKHQNTPVSEHIGNYIDHQTAKGVNSQRVKNTRSRLLRLADECNMHRLSDMTGDALERWLLDKAEHDDRTEKPMGAGARNGYREAAIGFGNWLVKKKRIKTNPFSEVPKADAKADCRRKRRALHDSELQKLLDVARCRPLQEAMTVRRGKNKGQLKANIRPEVRQRLERLGRERALIYKTMALTGLRKKELATLTVDRLELDVEPPHLVLNPNNEKNREGNAIPIRSDLADDLRVWLRDKAEEVRESNGQSGQHSEEELIYGLPPDTLLFDVPTGLLRILNLDLKAAGIPKKDSRGRTVDIHALRHTFGTMLSAAGVRPRTAQEAMRHSTLDLTMNVYTDPALLDVAGAIESLPSFTLGEGPAAAVESATAALKEGSSEDESSRLLAPVLAFNMHRSGQSGSTPVKMAVPDAAPAELLSRAVKSCYDNSKGPLSIADNEPFESGRLDLNQRPLRPERSALARLSYAPIL